MATAQVRFVSEFMALAARCCRKAPLARCLKIWGEHPILTTTRAHGKVLKVVAPLLRFVPAGIPCRLFFVDRNLDEILAS